MTAPFTTDGKEFYVKFDHTGITPLVAAIDGLTMITWETDQTTYMKVKDVIAWYEKELGFDKHWETGHEMLKHFRSELAKFRDGKVDVNQ